MKGRCNYKISARGQRGALLAQAWQRWRTHWERQGSYKWLGEAGVLDGRPAQVFSADAEYSQTMTDELTEAKDAHDFRFALTRWAHMTAEENEQLCDDLEGVEEGWWSGESSPRVFCAHCCAGLYLKHEEPVCLWHKIEDDTEHCECCERSAWKGNLTVGDEQADNEEPDEPDESGLAADPEHEDVEGVADE